MKAHVVIDASLNQLKSAIDVRINKRLGRLQGIIIVALSSKVNNYVGLPHQLLHKSGVQDVSLGKVVLPLEPTEIR